MKRKVVSPMGLYLVPKIKKFLLDNAKSFKDGATVEDGAKATSNAIEYAWNLAWSSNIMSNAFSAGIAPAPVPPSVVTAGGPVGTLIYSVLKPQCLEP